MVYYIILNTVIIANCHICDYILVFPLVHWNYLLVLLKRSSVQLVLDQLMVKTWCINSANVFVWLHSKDYFSGLLYADSSDISGFHDLHI